LKTLILGASGATGNLLVEQLLSAGQDLKIIVRPTGNIPATWHDQEKLEIIRAHIAEIKVEEMVKIISDCDSVAVCLGHNLTLKGLFGKPRKLVTNAVKLTSEAIQKLKPQKPVKFVLMNTAGNRNRDLKEPISFGERFIITLLRLLLPPHPDNEQAAEHLRLKIGQQSKFIEWAVVRPDTLLDETEVSQYSLHPSPTTSAFFKPGKTSKINVAHFMAQLILDIDLWNEWKGKMPVIYNQI
jgi:nucleoside-diphosphate-sugar epimerase